MGWTAPRTWVTGEVVTASLLNTHLRDNLIDLDRRTTVAAATVVTSQTTTSDVFADLATVGPAVSVTIGSTGQALVSIFAQMSNNTANSGFVTGFAVSGATTIAASLAFAVGGITPVANQSSWQGATFLVEALTAGSNTFICMYRRLVGNTASFAERKILVTPLGS